METKTNSRSVNQKLKQYSLIAGAIVAAAPVANAEVIYTDIPDEVINLNEAYALDLNNDGTPDFGFGVLSADGTGTQFGFATTYDRTAAGVSAYGANRIQSSAYTFVIVPTEVVAVNAYSAMISNSSAWSSGTAAIKGLAISSYVITPFGNTTNTGLPFNNVSSQYMGVTLDIAGAKHYGWIKLSVSAGGKTITIHDYAYEDVATWPINAGFTVGVGDREAKKATIYSYGDQINVKGVNGKGGTVVVYDQLGKQVQQTTYTGKDASLNVKGNGIYLVKVTSGGVTSTRKVYIN